MPSRLSPLMVAIASIVLALPASSIVIDDFESGGPFVLTDDGTSAQPTATEQSGLLGSSVIGGVRLVSANAAGGPADVASASLASTGGDDSLVLTYGDFTSGSFTLTYDGVADGNPNTAPPGLLNADLSADGGIGIDLHATAAGATINAYIYTTFLFNPADPVSPFYHIYQTGPVAVGAGSGTVYFDFAQFTGLLGQVNPADVKTIRFQIQNVQPGNTLTLNNIATVIPEPGTAALLGMGLLGLAMRRRTR